MRSLGVDVGGEHRKDLDVVVLDGDRQVVAVGSQVPVRRLRGMIETYRPDVVCVDGPPGWAASGGRSRLAERELKLLGIQAYYTPDKATGEANPFYDWMRNALAAFRAADRAGFSVYRSGSIHGSAVEVFPHASATVLAGCLAPARQTPSAKRAWRAAILRAQHVPTAHLATLDHIDAALCALTGLIGLELGDPFAPGAPDEGRIMLPARVVPAAGYRRCVQTRAVTTEPLITFCACGCGEQVRPGREFRPGHDRRLMVQLERRGWT